MYPAIAAIRLSLLHSKWLGGVHSHTLLWYVGTVGFLKKIINQITWSVENTIYQWNCSRSTITDMLQCGQLLVLAVARRVLLRCPAIPRAVIFL